MLFKEALRTGFFEFQAIRDKYRELSTNEGMHRDLIMKFIEVQALLMSPICPHVAEHVWGLIGRKGSIVTASWPKAGVIDELQIKRSNYLMDAAHSFRLFLKNYLQGQKAQKGKAVEKVVKPNSATIWVAKTFPPWQSCVLTTMKTLYDVCRNENSCVEIIFYFLEERKSPGKQGDIVGTSNEARIEKVHETCDAFRANGSGKNERARPASVVVNVGV